MDVGTMMGRSVDMLEVEVALASMDIIVMNLVMVQGKKKGATMDSKGKVKMINL